MYKYLRLYKDIANSFLIVNLSHFFLTSKIPTLSKFLFFIHRELFQV